MINAGSFVLLFSAGVIFCDDSVHTTVLDPDGKYHISWELLREEQEIVFHLEVQTHGYVGLGLSPNGGMNGSDIVTGWIKDGKIYFQDRHGTGNRLPPVDRTQDWHVLSGNENDTHTSLVFRRKLITCDQEDMEID
ncbi:DBH-like monooxygenase protein 1 homolog, partial [Stegodyphus dumicola]|uniref:DBH-like monooxygenase protein 1 homolog n=1 Tax=Stegodyphus dumicola TaxID=202533 RepID=UPI0015A91D9B